MTSETDAAQNEKTIEVRLRFWTNGIAETEGKIRPGHCWPSGMVIIPKNDSHGIASQRQVPFNSLMTITSAIEEAMAEADIAVHMNTRKRPYRTEG